MFNQNCIDFSDDWKIFINHLTFQDLRVNFELLLQNIKDAGKKVSLWLQVTRHFVLLKYEWIIAIFSRKSDSTFTNVCLSVVAKPLKQLKINDFHPLHPSSFIIHHSSLILRLLSFSACFFYCWWMFGTNLRTINISKSNIGTWLGWV